MLHLRILKALFNLFYLALLSVSVLATIGMFNILRTFESTVVPIVCIVILWVFVYAMHLVRETISLFSKSEFFSGTVVRNFRKSGICVLVFTAIAHWISFKADVSQIGDQFLTIGTLVAFSILAFFLLAMAEVFERARIIKEENDLTL